MTPLACLERRFSALQNRDYQAVYASYHKNSPFLQQFSSPDSYTDFAIEHLSCVRVRSWVCQQLRWLSEDQVECLLVIDMQIAGVNSWMFELALLIRTDVGWRYHSAQKLDPEACPLSSHVPDFSDFDNAEQRVRF